MFFQHLVSPLDFNPGQAWVSSPTGLDKQNQFGQDEILAMIGWALPLPPLCMGRLKVLH